jgi:hypothetical protein
LPLAVGWVEASAVTDPAHALADDLDTVVEAACDALTTVVDLDWRVPAAGLTWTCWGTIEHTADDLFAYAGQLTGRRTALDTYVPFAFHSLAEGEPVATIHAEDGRGNTGLVEVLDATGRMLSAAARHADPRARGWHPYGVSGPGGFAAMGTAETLLHLHDVAGALGFGWAPDQEVARRVLDRLFPEVAVEADPWSTLLWAAGRGDLPGRERLHDWRWDGTVRA